MHVKVPPTRDPRICLSAYVACKLAMRQTNQVDRDEYYKVHHGVRRLIRGWLAKGLEQDDEGAFESFIYLWIGFNAWAACVTHKDRDKEMVNALALDERLNDEFASLLDQSPELGTAAGAFHELWPIFRVQELRERGVPYHLQPSGQPRAEVVESYLQAGARQFEPECWIEHAASADGAPLDWAHTVNGIYRVRCNLFHGEKARTSEDDMQIVAAARDVLAAFLEEGNLAM
jgi:hypothetical protein